MSFIVRKYIHLTFYLFFAHFSHWILQSSNDPWVIGDVSFQASQTENKIHLSHPVGGSPDAMNVSLFDLNCINEVNDSAVAIPYEQFDQTARSFDYDIKINTTEIGKSNLVTFDNSTVGTGDSKGSINFCTRVVTTYTGKSFDVSFRETNFQMNFDLTNNDFTAFSLDDISISENDAEDFDTDVNTTFSVSAYLCDDALSPLPISTVYQQNEALKICLTPSSSFVEISNFEMKMTSTDGYTYNPVSYGNQVYAPNTLTTVVEDPSGSTDTLKVTTAIVANMFLGGGSSVDITGNAFLMFKSAKATSNTQFVPFKLKVMIKVDELQEGGCFVKLFQILKVLF